MIGCSQLVMELYKRDQPLNGTPDSTPYPHVPSPSRRRSPSLVKSVIAHSDYTRLPLMMSGTLEGHHETRNRARDGPTLVVR